MGGLTNGYKVPGDVSCYCNNQVADGTQHKSVVLGRAFGEADVRKEDRLVQVDTVERD